MRRIFKYPVPTRQPKFKIKLPEGFKFCRLHWQHDKLYMWAEIRQNSPEIEYEFQVLGTGHDIPDGATYLSTYDDGPFVFHLYRVGAA